MYLIDTNVLSEQRKGTRAHAGVIRFFNSTQGDDLFLPVQVVGEIQAGIFKLRRKGGEHAEQQADTYKSWLEKIIADFDYHILKFDIDAAVIWGTLLSTEKKDPHSVDKQIAAIALLHDFIVVTRDKGEAFSNISGLKVIDPFDVS